MKYIVMIDGKDFEYKTFPNAFKKYENTKDSHLKALFELYLNNQKLYENRLLFSNYQKRKTDEVLSLR